VSVGAFSAIGFIAFDSVSSFHQVSLQIRLTSKES